MANNELIVVIHEAATLSVGFFEDVEASDWNALPVRAGDADELTVSLEDATFRVDLAPLTCEVTWITVYDDDAVLSLGVAWRFNPDLEFFLDDDGCPGMDPNELRVAVVAWRNVSRVTVSVDRDSTTIRAVASSFVFDVPDGCGSISVQGWDGDTLVGCGALPVANDKLRRRRWVLLEDGAVDIVFRMATNPTRAAYYETPAGLAVRARRRFRVDDNALSLRGVHLGDLDLKLIGALLDEESLTKLDLRGCGLDAPRLTVLTECVKRNSSLRSLDLSANSFPDGSRDASLYPPVEPNRGLGALGQATRNASLRRLDLSESGLEARGTSALARGLRYNAVLQHLVLARNRICDVTNAGLGVFEPSGVLDLAQAVEVHPQLRQLDLSRVQICGVTAPWRKPGPCRTFRTDALVALLRSVRFSDSLHDVNLTDNGILEAGGRPLLEAVATARSCGAVGFRLVERVGKDRRHYCIMRRPTEDTSSNTTNHHQEPQFSWHVDRLSSIPPIYCSKRTTIPRP